MNELGPELKAKWVAALRSGEYKQCTKQLTKDGGYCCLGVLAKISDRLGEYGRFKHSNSMGSRNWLAGLGVGDVGAAEIIPYSKQGLLMRANDLGKTFLEIADIIEADKEI